MYVCEKHHCEVKNSSSTHRASSSTHRASSSTPIFRLNFHFMLDFWGSRQNSYRIGLQFLRSAFVAQIHGVVPLSIKFLGVFPSFLYSSYLWLNYLPYSSAIGIFSKVQLLCRLGSLECLILSEHARSVVGFRLLQISQNVLPLFAAIIPFISSKAPSDPMLSSHLKFKTIWFAGIHVALCMCWQAALFFIYVFVCIFLSI